MKRIRHGLLLGMLLTAVWLTACDQTPAQTPTTITESPLPGAAMKGMDLYSWQNEAGSWRFAILPGTNRQKTADELVTEAINLEAVKSAFGDLPAGELLYWNNAQTVATADRLVLTLPPGEVVSTLRAHAAAAQIELILPAE